MQQTENEVLLLEHGITYSKFSQNVLECLPPKPYIITQEEVDNRVNLKHRRVFSIDPPGCTDIDDALHVEVCAGRWGFPRLRPYVLRRLIKGAREWQLRGRRAYC